jgi:hypothetical protein
MNRRTFFGGLIATAIALVTKPFAIVKDNPKVKVFMGTDLSNLKEVGEAKNIMVMESTAKGRNEWFYDRYVNGESFTMKNKQSGSAIVFRNGMLLEEGEDYHREGNEIRTVLKQG